MIRNFINPPKQTNIVKYSKAIEELIVNFSKLKDVVAIFSYGGFGNPGISDLDIFVVLNGDLQYSNTKDYGISRERFPDLFDLPKGTLMIMPREQFKLVHWLDDGINLKKLYGQQIDFEIPLDRLVKKRSLASVVDWLPERLGALSKLYLSTDLDITFSLRLLKSYCYTLRKIDEINRKCDYSELVDKITNLRSFWRDERQAELLKTLEMAIKTGFAAMHRFCLENFGGEESAEGWLKLFPQLQLLFVKDLNNVSFKYMLACSGKKSGKIIVPVPAFLAPHFSFYSQQPGFLAEQMRRQINLPILKPRDGLYREFLENKMEVATRCGEFLLKNGFKDGLFRFGFYFKNYLVNNP